MNDLDQITQSIGAELRALRTAAGYSNLEQFAFEKKLSRLQYYKMEKGTNFTLLSLLKVLNAHEVDFYAFVKKLDPQNKTYAH